jgi:hypothetical protein
MRLLRLTSEDRNGLFDAKFDTDIKIKKGDQIALQSASFSEQINVLVIDSTNNNLSFQYKNGASIDIDIAEGTYDDTNKDDLFLDITNKLNLGVPFQSGKEIGAVYDCDVDTTTNKVNIGYLRSDFLSASARVARNQSAFSIVGGNPAMEPLTNKLQSTIGDTTDDRSKYVSLNGWNPFGGGMMWRMKICNYVDNASGVDNNGFTMGLSDISPNDPTNGWTNKDTMSNADKTYALHFKRLADDLQIKQKGGAFTNTGVQANKLDQASDDNDVYEWHIDQGKLKCIQYKITGGVGGVETATTLLDIDLPQGTKLYPFLVLHGGVNSIKVRSVVNTIDPYQPATPNDKTTYINNLVNDDNHPDNALEADGMLGAPNFSGGNGLSDNLLSMSVGLSSFFGYESNNIFSQGGPNFFFEAESVFLATLSNVSFIIELRNIQIDSYNSATGQRQNIVAVVPTTGSNAGGDDIIEYEPNNLYFIDVLEDSLVRNFTARILRIDGSQVRLSGISVLTLLLK